MVYYRFIGAMSDEQEAVFNEFKQWVISQGIENPWFNDSFLSRFCRARQFKIDKIIEMFSNYMQYRKDNNLDTIVNVSEK